MEHKTNFTDEQLRYLRMLSKQYPTVQAASKELVRLNAVLNLPKGTEHFMSDIHGEYIKIIIIKIIYFIILYYRFQIDELNNYSTSSVSEIELNTAVSK